MVSEVDVQALSIRLTLTMTGSRVLSYMHERKEKIYIPPVIRDLFIHGVQKIRAFCITNIEILVFQKFWVLHSVRMR